MFGFKRSPYKREVARGAKLLDATTPDWFDIVDPTTLDMSHSSWCVVGQLSGPHGGYSRKLHSMGLSASTWAVDKKKSPVHFGFDISTEMPTSDYGVLQELWCAEIHKRRIARVGHEPAFV